MTTTDVRPSGLRRLLESGGLIAVAIVVMNMSTYGFQMVAARLVGPEEYGSIASLLAIQLVSSVLQLGLQATAARRIAAAPDDVAEVEHGILRLGWRAAGALTLVLLALSPLISHLLHLQSLYPALLLAVGALPMNVQGAQCGILQGERRWGALALVYLAAGVPRLAIGAIALSVRATEGAGMAAVALGWIAPCAVGWWFLSRGRHARPRRGGRSVAQRQLATEVAHSSLALLGFFALSNIDIVMSRHILTPHGSGLYAGGLILTKAVLFLPQFVSIVAFPAMSTPAERRTVMLRALGMVAVVGAGSLVGSVVLADVAMVFVGGSDYDPIRSRLWQFAALGMLLAALQLLVYSVLARQSRRSAWFIWAAVIVMGLVGWWRISSMAELLALATATDAVLFVVLFGMSLWTMRADSTESPSVGGVVPTAPGADTHV
ncbi:lipopolysaccharide biosynthesis protein [Nocardioides sp. Kera G14]|uniref:lipopolysaccharide biosynthesis protein n=1 Tax=Nocardioides sp. Kera G14 TaxID=2884264 RepID=UPI001D0FFA8F|nr:oligosaccharide flippase family protein [Nocardioides sp. Kera G14]UDY22428.1 oligosaccharide flippase family protein [Nocardioides sp. Kera G14]